MAFSFRLSFVECKRIDEIFFGRVKKPDSHLTDFPIPGKTNSVYAFMQWSMELERCYNATLDLVGNTMLHLNTAELEW